MILSAEVLITALYLDDGEELQSIQRTVQTDCRLDCPVQAVCQCWCTAPGELAVVPAAGGLEVRFTLEFHCLCLAERRQAAISSARLGEERAKPDGTQPSVVLRMAARESGCGTSRKRTVLPQRRSPKPMSWRRAACPRAGCS